MTSSASAHKPDRKLRIVVFTAGPLTPVNRVFFARLARDPLLDLRGIIVDEYERPKKPLLVRVSRGIRREGVAWLIFKIRTLFMDRVHKAARRLFDWLHPPTERPPSYEDLARETGIPVHHVQDIHSEHGLASIRSLDPQLGLIVGGRILRDSVIEIPEYGTLNIHKHKVPQYRGGGPPGYWEILAGESSVGVTIHYATARVDAGPVLAQSTILIEACDTLESLRIKADIRGARLYHETVSSFARGFRDGTHQDEKRGVTLRAPSEVQVWRLERKLRRKQARIMPSGEGGASWWTRTRLLIQYVLLLPLLYRTRRQLLRTRRAPVGIFFYHLVSNRPLNHMCLPLEEFVRQVEFLLRYYRVVSLEEAVERVRSASNSEVLAALTFDDGYRDNAWVLEYLRYLGVPAAFFVSAGHVRDGRLFEHDRLRGFDQAIPMAPTDLVELTRNGFLIGSHGLYHEDFGVVDPQAAEKVFRESRRWIARLSGKEVDHFSFPKGLRGKNISPENFELAQKHFRYVYSAYGGYNFPEADRRHFLRIGTPGDLLELARVMDGYTGFRECLRGDAWGVKSGRLPPYSVAGLESAEGTLRVQAGASP